MEINKLLREKLSEFINSINTNFHNLLEEYHDSFGYFDYNNITTYNLSRIIGDDNVKTLYQCFPKIKLFSAPIKDMIFDNKKLSQAEIKREIPSYFYLDNKEKNFFVEDMLSVESIADDMFSELLNTLICFQKESAIDEQLLINKDSVLFLIEKENLFRVTYQLRFIFYSTWH